MLLRIGDGLRLLLVTGLAPADLRAGRGGIGPGSEIFLLVALLGSHTSGSVCYRLVAWVSSRMTRTSLAWLAEVAGLAPGSVGWVLPVLA